MIFERQRNTSAAAHDLAHQLSAAARPTNDLPDRGADLHQGADSAVNLLAPEIAFMLQALRVGQQGRIEDGGTRAPGEWAASIAAPLPGKRR
jgi:hypothetical protein